MDKESSQELLVENKIAGFSTVLLPYVRIKTPYLRRVLPTLLKITILARERECVTVELVPQLDCSCSLQDVLRDTLSRLSIKDVVRMSVLSREWRQQRICHPDLVLTKDTFGISTDTNTDPDLDFYGIIKDINTKRASWTAEFIANVDSVLRPLWSTSTTTTTTLDKFGVEFGLRRKNKYHIDRWVSFSIVSRAKHIAFHFTFDVDCFGPGCDQYKYVFPLCRLSGPSGSCVTSLILGYVWLKLPPRVCGVIYLRKLTLNTVSISDDDLRCLLLSCALLESINIEWCDSLSSLLIGQELCRLQYLRVRHCELKMIELHAPNLTKFEFDDYVMQTVLSDSSKLSEAIFVSNLRVLDGYDDVLDYMFTELPTALPHVHTLLLLLTVNQVRSRNELLISFSNFTFMIFTFSCLFTCHIDRFKIK